MSTENPAPTPAEVVPPATPAQEEVDWKAEARKWEQRSKENKSALDELTSKFTSAETEKGELAKKVQEFEAKEARATLVAKVAKDTGVPAEALRGDSEDDLKAHAETLKALIKPSGPVIPSQDKHPAEVESDPMREFTKNIFASTANE